MIRIFDDFASLFYPRLCLACRKNLPYNQECICVHCQYHLPKTHFHLDKENPFTERFWGRLPLVAGAALYHFSKGGRTQALIHQLKYQHKTQIGLKLGRLYGQQLVQQPSFQSVDLILPVPLHPRKKRLRGYNQSDFFAQGLSDGMQRPWMNHALVRTEDTSSQTRKSRMDRFRNVENAFAIPDPNQLKNRHILLVDDVLTTGATLEACAQTILKVEGTRVSMATMAIASEV
ncbi:MAG: ComF family protein [Bacteroidota bacterium]